MFHTEQVDKRPSWYRGYDSLGTNENGDKAYHVIAHLEKIQFDTIEEAEEAARKLTHFWNTEFVFKNGK